jgi:hypothetical protein
MAEHTVNEIVEKWLGTDTTKRDPTAFDDDAVTPEVGWSAILQILQHDLSESEIARLAAGPVEELLAQHGPAFIGKVENEARQSPRFRYLLTGVWRCGMPQDIWDRVRRARGEQV